jgi:inhibitor of KinA
LSAHPIRIVELRPLGDRAVTVTVGTRIDEATRVRILSLCAALDARPPEGLVVYVPAFASLTVHYDPARVPADASDSTPYERFGVALRAILESAPLHVAGDPRVIEVGVAYGGEFGPDLEDVARHAGVSADEVVRLHTSGDYVVHMVGFIAGFAYLGGLPARIATPRRAVPRTRVPASSVGIGGSQTGVYPVDSPGGWNVIGRTPLRMFDAVREPATLLRTGDRVRFVAITPDEFHTPVTAR